MKHLLKSNQKIVSSKGFQNYKLNITDGNKAKLSKKNSNSSRAKLLTGREAYNDQLHSLYELLYKIIESSSKIENSKEYNSDKKEHNSD
jgi:hypothetical protein